MTTLDTRQKLGLPPPKPSDVANALGITNLSIDWLAGDGSDRCYYRIKSPEIEQPLVLMQLSGSDAQALMNNGYDWIKIAETLQANAIPVPSVIAPMPQHAALVIEDYGDTMLEGKIIELIANNEIDSVFDLYDKAAKIAANFLSIPQSSTATWCSRSFDAERFTWELNFFLQKYGEPIAGLHLSTSEQRLYDAEVAAISKFIASHSNYFVHRDYHSRNIMIREEQLAIIDFQDARIGPAAYDLVSLAFDSYVPLSINQRLKILEKSIDIVALGYGKTIADEIRHSWKAVLLQRQLKAIGSFGFLTNDKKRGNYLQYVRPALMTLESGIIFDSRWPFLSLEIPNRLRNSINVARS